MGQVNLVLQWNVPVFLMWLQSVSKQIQKHSDAVVKCYRGENKLILLNAVLTYCNLVSKTSPRGNNHLSTCVTSAVGLVIWSCWCFHCSQFDWLSSCSSATRVMEKKMWIYRGLKKSFVLISVLSMCWTNELLSNWYYLYGQISFRFSGVFLFVFFFFLGLYLQAIVSCLCASQPVLYWSGFPSAFFSK